MYLHCIISLAGCCKYPHSVLWYVTELEQGIDTLLKIMIKKKYKGNKFDFVLKIYIS